MALNLRTAAFGTSGVEGVNVAWCSVFVSVWSKSTTVAIGESLTEFIYFRKQIFIETSDKNVTRLQTQTCFTSETFCTDR